MDDDESFILIVSLIVALVAAIHWIFLLLGKPRRRPIVRLPLLITPPVLVGFCWFVLRRWADHEVRESIEYQILFVSAGVVALSVAGMFLRVLGVSQRDDAIERNNAGAAIVMIGAWTGVMLCYAGANIGEGPTIYTTLGPAAAGVSCLFVLWLIHAVISGVVDQVTIERDAAAALRAAGLYVATGAILGRTVAGDWAGVDSFFADLLHLGWPAALLAIVAAAVDRVHRPTVANPRPAWMSAGALPASVYLIAAAIVISVEGSPVLKGYR